MSELTPCNYCSLRDIKRRAVKRDQKVTLLNSSGGKIRTTLQSGYDITVLVHRRDEVPDKEKHFAAWFMRLTDHCVC